MPLDPVVFRRVSPSRLRNGLRDNQTAPGSLTVVTEPVCGMASVDGCHSRQTVWRDCLSPAVAGRGLTHTSRGLPILGPEGWPEHALLRQVRQKSAVHHGACCRPPRRVGHELAAIEDGVLIEVCALHLVTGRLPREQKAHI